MLLMTLLKNMFSSDREKSVSITDQPAVCGKLRDTVNQFFLFTRHSDRY